MHNNYLPGFYFQETACWLGFVVATLLATWSLACARALELATAAAPHPPITKPTAARSAGVQWYNSPACLNTLFLGLMAVFVVHTLVWAGLTDRAFRRMIGLMQGAVVAELVAGAEGAVGMGEAEFEVAKERAVEVVQRGLNEYERLVWYVKGAFLSCAAHDLITWFVSRTPSSLVSPPLNQLCRTPLAARAPRFNPVPHSPPPPPLLLPHPPPSHQPPSDTHLLRAPFAPPLLLARRPPPGLPLRRRDGPDALARVPGLRGPRARAGHDVRRV